MARRAKARATGLSREHKDSVGNVVTPLNNEKKTQRRKGAENRAENGS